jgi:hypothetical protein
LLRGIMIDAASERSEQGRFLSKSPGSSNAVMFPEKSARRYALDLFFGESLMLHSGLDLHKRTVVISTVNDAGEPVDDVSLPTTRATVRAYFERHAGPHRAVVESTANAVISFRRRT